MKASSGLLKVTDGPQDSTSEKIVKWWPIVASLIGALILGATTQAQVQAQAARLDKLENVSPQLDARLGRIETSLDAVKSQQATNRAETLQALNRLDDKIQGIVDRR